MIHQNPPSFNFFSSSSYTRVTNKDSSINLLIQSYSLYVDANSLYSWALSQKSVKDLIWIDPNIRNWNKREKRNIRIPEEVIIVV